MPIWTPAQSAAIETTGTDILVSAAAGSGKTAALTERIIRHITAGGSLDRMLIVTFSRASAADMKAKLSRELRRRAEDDPNDKTLARALAELPSARIGTIHSFCSSLLRRYYGELSLPAKSRIADDAEAKLMKTECMEETLDYFFSLPAADGHDSAADGNDSAVDGNDSTADGHDPETNFIALTDHLLGGESDEALGKLLLSLYEKTSCLPRRYETLADSASELRLAAEDGGFLRSSCGDSIRRHIGRGLEHYIAVMDAACRELALLPDFAVKYLPAFDYISNFLHRAERLLAVGDYDALAGELSAFAPPRLGSVKGEKPPRTEYFKAKKTELASFIKSTRERYFSISGDALAVTLRRTASVTLGIVRVLAEFDRRYTAEKRRRGALDYEDLEHYALRILSDPALASAVAADCDEIYIDEYQDVNSVQNTIFEAMSKKNRFMVGDVKQSIYAFRGADPTLFDSLRGRYRKIDTDAPAPIDDGLTEGDSVGGDSVGGASVFMSDNFRCDESVIKFTNAVCGRIMPYGNVTYSDEDALRHGKTEPDSDGFPVRIILADPGADTSDDVDDNTDTDDIEPEAIAEEVSRLLREGRRRDGNRITTADIAILLRSATGGRAERIEDACRRRSIAVSNDTKPNFFECPEVLLVLCLLNTVNNPLRDIYLAGALRSPVFAFTLDELIAIGEGNSRAPLYRSLRELAESEETSPLAEKCRSAYKTILRWREAARFASSADVIALIYKETGIEALLWSEANCESSSVPPELRAENLSALYEYARSYESVSHRGLHRFLDYISSMIERGVTTVGEPTAASAENVRIMTVHQSKGLEFPVVILAYSASARNSEDTKGSLIYDKNAGLAMRLRADDEGESPLMLETLPRRAVAAAVSDTLAAEEMRILYVALTRARERLIITAKIKDAQKAIDRRRTEAEFFGGHTVYSERSYIGWILSSLFAEEHAGLDIRSFCEIRAVGPGVTGSNLIVGKAADENAPAPAPDRALVDEYKELIRSRLSYTYPYSRLGKLPAKLAVSALYPAVLDEDATDISDDFDSPPAPASPEAEAAARAGTATHLYMQFCDFAKAEANGVRAEAERLVSLGFLRPQDANLIRYDEAEAFLASHIYGEMKRARQIWRERRFNIRLPAADFTMNPADRELYSGEELLIQGVIDCFFISESGELVLLDYKTDRLSPYELSHRRAAEEKLISRHARQLSYYSSALHAMFGKRPEHVYIYSMPLGDTVEVASADDIR